MADNQVLTDVPVVLPPEDGSGVEVPAAPPHNQEAVQQGNHQQALSLEVYKTFFPLHVV